MGALWFFFWNSAAWVPAGPGAPPGVQPTYIRQLETLASAGLSKV